MRPSREYERVRFGSLVRRTLCSGARGHACPGDYTWGDFQSSECPAGSHRITEEAHCRSAALAFGLFYRYSASNADLASGCISLARTLDVMLNTHKTGCCGDVYLLWLLGHGSAPRDLATCARNVSRCTGA